MKPILRFFGRQIIRYLEKPITNYRSYQFIPLADLEVCLKPGDILLVEGNQRVSSAIKYLTQSTWSHAAYYVGREAGLPGLQVANSKAALGQLAAGWRAQFKLPLVAVTGSNGKTTGSTTFPLNK